MGRSPATVLAALREIDVPGIGLFATVITATLILLLSIAENPQLWLAPVIAAAVLLVVRERRIEVPFLDVRGFASNRALTSVLIQQGVVNLVFHALFSATSAPSSPAHCSAWYSTRT